MIDLLIDWRVEQGFTPNGAIFQLYHRSDVKRIYARTKYGGHPELISEMRLGETLESADSI